MLEEKKREILEQLNQAQQQVAVWTRTQFALEGKLALVDELIAAAGSVANGEDKSVQQLKEV